MSHHHQCVSMKWNVSGTRHDFDHCGSIDGNKVSPSLLKTLPGGKKETSNILLHFIFHRKKIYYTPRKSNHRIMTFFSHQVLLSQVHSTLQRIRTCISTTGRILMRLKILEWWAKVNERHAFSGDGSVTEILRSFSCSSSTTHARWSRWKSRAD